MRHVNERRHAMLAAVEADGRADDIAALASCIVEPLAAVVAETGGWYGRFLARTQWDPFARRVLAGLPVLSSYARACELVGRALSDVPDRLRAQRLDEMESLLIGTIAGWEWRHQRGEPTLPLDALQLELTATITALLDRARHRPDRRSCDRHAHVHARPGAAGAHLDGRRPADRPPRPRGLGRASRTRFTLTPCSPTIGAEVHGVDARRPSTTPRSPSCTGPCSSGRCCSSATPG